LALRKEPILGLSSGIIKKFICLDFIAKLLGLLYGLNSGISQWILQYHS
jgi:hypothetical protein